MGTHSKHLGPKGPKIADKRIKLKSVATSQHSSEGRVHPIISVMVVIDYIYHRHLSSSRILAILIIMTNE